MIQNGKSFDSAQLMMSGTMDLVKPSQSPAPVVNDKAKDNKSFAQHLEKAEKPAPKKKEFKLKEKQSPAAKPREREEAPVKKKTPPRPERSEKVERSAQKAPKEPTEAPVRRRAKQTKFIEKTEAPQGKNIAKMDKPSEEVSLREIPSMKEKQKVVLQEAPILAILNGDFSLVEGGASQLVETISSNKLVKSVLNSDVRDVFSQKRTPGEWLAEIGVTNISPEELTAAFNIDPNQEIGLKSLLRGLGLDAGAIRTELQIMKKNIEAGDLTTYITRAHRKRGIRPDQIGKLQEVDESDGKLTMNKPDPQSNKKQRVIETKEYLNSNKQIPPAIQNKLREAIAATSGMPGAMAPKQMNYLRDPGEVSHGTMGKDGQIISDDALVQANADQTSLPLFAMKAGGEGQALVEGVISKQATQMNVQPLQSEEIAQKLPLDMMGQEKETLSPEFMNSKRELWTGQQEYGMPIKEGMISPEREIVTKEQMIPLQSPMQNPEMIQQNLFTNTSNTSALPNTFMMQTPENEIYSPLTGEGAFSFPREEMPILDQKVMGQKPTMSPEKMVMSDNMAMAKFLETKESLITREPVVEEVQTPTNPMGTNKSEGENPFSETFTEGIKPAFNLKSETKMDSTLIKSQSLGAAKASDLMPTDTFTTGEESFSGQGQEQQRNEFSYQKLDKVDLSRSDAPKEAVKDAPLFSVERPSMVKAGAVRTGPAAEQIDFGNDRAENIKAMIDKIVEKTELQVKSGGGTARLILKPDQYGKMAVNISVHDKIVKLDVVVDSPEVRQMLEGNMDRLRESLQSQNMEFEELNVTVGGESASSEEDLEEKREGHEESSTEFTVFQDEKKQEQTIQKQTKKATRSYISKDRVSVQA